MTMGFRLLLFAAIVCAGSDSARSDDWPAPQVKEVFSVSRDHFVRVIPGTDWGGTFGFASEARGPNATAEFYQRQRDRSYRLTRTVSLLNPIAPVEFFISNDGQLATIDNWHNLGYGAVVSIYSAEGALVRRYALGDLFSPAEIAAFPHSESSIGWHSGPVYITQDQETLYIMIGSGRDLSIDLGNGQFQYCETRDSGYACRDSNIERRWRPYRA